MGERETEREKVRERERHTERGRDIYRERKRHMQRETERKRHKQTNTQTQRERVMAEISGERQKGAGIEYTMLSLSDIKTPEVCS